MEKTKGMEPWYTSKTKWGALLVGLSFIFATIGGWLNGTIEFTTALNSLIAEIGGIYVVFGFRDWPIFNKK